MAKIVKRTAKGTFEEGTSGNPKGRPVGSKNKVTIMQTALQEGFLEGNSTKIQQILNSVVQSALEGDKTAIKMIWDANIAKPSLKEEKGDKTNAPQITIRHMEVSKKGDVIELEPIGDTNDE